VTEDSLADRIARRASDAGITLTDNDLGHLTDYWALLERWNKRINLTALPLQGSPESSIDRLLIEPLAAAVLVDTGPIRWLDLGSGGGSPAIPLKIMRPASRLTMVESRSKKVAFLREAIRQLGLAGTEVLNMRSDDLLGGGDPVQLITARGVRFDDGISKVVGRLLPPGGRLVLFGPASPSPPNPEGFRLERTIKVPGTNSAVFALERLTLTH
jgi:16S rRNA (guanine527-N7)-methyltransferase